MKANSDTLPKKFEKSNNKIQFRYNITEVEKLDETTGKSRTCWYYDYVEVNKTDRDTLIKAMIHDKFSIDDEIALINNKFKGDVKGNDEYAEYQNYRDTVKNTVEII